MMQLPGVAVIADDLTGGADTGVQFCPGLGPIYLSSGLRGRIGREAFSGHGVALYTNSRHAAPEEAAQRVGGAYDNIRHLSFACVYKKIDSCLRGNVGAELDSLLQAMGAPFSFVAPALPGQGRTTEHDIHMVHGVPVGRTEMARDPLCPVTESRLSVLLASQSRLRVGRVDLSVIDNGAPAVAETVAELVAAGCRHIVFDAVETRHLDCIIRVARSHFPDVNVLFAGSAGLAASLAAAMAAKSTPRGSAPPPRIGRWLFVCGSASATMAGQLRALVEQTSWRQLAIGPEGGGLPDTLGSAPSSLILSVGGAAVSRAAEKYDPAVILQRLAEAAFRAVTEIRPQGLFLSGGDTAEAVLERSGAAGLVLQEEIAPGLMLGTVAGGACDALPVVTKAGSFGTEKTLVELVKLLQ